MQRFVGYERTKLSMDVTFHNPMYCFKSNKATSYKYFRIQISLKFYVALLLNFDCNRFPQTSNFAQQRTSHCTIRAIYATLSELTARHRTLAFKKKHWPWSLYGRALKSVTIVDNIFTRLGKSKLIGSITITWTYDFLSVYAISRDSLVRVVSKLWTGRPRNPVHIIGNDNTLFSSPKCPRQLCSPPNHLLNE